VGFRCRICGKWHDELLFDLVFDEPMQVAELDEATRARQVTVLDDFRILRRDDATHYFILGMIELPIIGTTEQLRYVAWATLSATSFEAATNASRERTAAGPFFGWLSSSIPDYPPTAALPTHVHVRAGSRARIELEASEHPLSVDQRKGITLERVQQIVERQLHPPS
jgi:hypothetical protein